MKYYKNYTLKKLSKEQIHDYNCKYINVIYIGNNME